MATLSKVQQQALRRHKGRAKNVPARPDVLFLPSQERWIKDASRKKICEKSRQVGWTWTTAYAMVERTGAAEARYDQWVSSRDEMQARLFLEDCKYFADLLHIAFKDMGERFVDEDKHSAFVQSFANGKRIHSMSSNPNAQAGKRGGRALDEFALHPDPRTLYAIALPGITWGGMLEIFSTHRGSHNFFAKLIEEIRERGNPKGFSHHRFTLQDALDEGFLFKLQERLPEEDDRQAMDEADYFTAQRAQCPDEETFLQEYMCVPSDDASAFLPYDLITGCELRGADNPQPVTEKTRDYAGREGTIRRLRMYSVPELGDWDGDLYLGVDVGRDHDLTVLWLLGQSKGGLLLPVWITELRQVEFDRQESELYPLLGLPRLRRACLDNTGLGRQLGERAQKRFGKAKVELINFSGPVKESLAYPLRAAFEDRTVRIPADQWVVSDLRAIRKETTAAGNIRFASDRGKNGHADRFWAFALALHARSGAAAPVTFSRGRTRGDFAQRAERGGFRLVNGLW